MRGCKQLCLLTSKNLLIQFRSNYGFVLLQVICPMLLMVWVLWVRIAMPIILPLTPDKERTSDTIEAFVSSREDRPLLVGYAPYNELTCSIIGLMKNTLKSRGISHNMVIFEDFPSETDLINFHVKSKLNEAMEAAIIFNVSNPTAYTDIIRREISDDNKTNLTCTIFTDTANRSNLNGSQDLDLDLQELLSSLQVTVRCSVSLAYAHIWSRGYMWPRGQAKCDNNSLPDYTSKGTNLLLHMLMESLINQTTPASFRVNLLTHGIHCNSGTIYPFFKNFLTFFMPVMLSLPFLPSVVTILYHMMRERERRTQEILQMMGVSRSIYNLSWFIVVMAQILLGAFLTTWILFLPENMTILPRSDPTVVGSFLLAFGLSMASFCLLITAVCSKAKTAVTTFILCNIEQLLHVAYAAIHSQEMNREEKSSFSLWYLCALEFACWCMIKHEETGEGMNWKNLFTPSTLHDSISVGYCGLVMVTVATFLLLLTFLISTGVWSRLLFPVYFTARKVKHCWEMRQRKNKTSAAESASDINDTEDRKLTVESKSEIFVQFDHVTLPETKKNHALHHVSLKINMDQTTVLLGHSHSGKSTVVKILTGLVKPKEGWVKVSSKPLQKYLKKQTLSIGLCPKYNYFFKQLTIRENIHLILGLRYGKLKVAKQNVEEVVRLSNLASHADVRVESLSTIQTRMLALAIACSKETGVIVLEEPTFGVSEDQEVAVLTSIEKMLKGRTTLITSSSALVATRLAQKIGVFANGKHLCYGNKEYVKELFGAGYQLETKCTPECSLESLINYMMLIVPKLLYLDHQDSTYKFLLPENATVKFEYLLSNLRMRDRFLGINNFRISCVKMEDLFSRMRNENTMKAHFLKCAKNRGCLDMFSVGSAIDISVPRPKILYSAVYKTPSGHYSVAQPGSADISAMTCDQKSNIMTFLLKATRMNNDKTDLLTRSTSSKVDGRRVEQDPQVAEVFERHKKRRKASSDDSKGKTAKFKAFVKPARSDLIKKSNMQIFFRENKNINAKKCHGFGCPNVEDTLSSSFSKESLLETEFNLGASVSPERKRLQIKNCEEDTHKEGKIISFKSTSYHSKFVTRLKSLGEPGNEKGEHLSDKKIKYFSNPPQKSKNYAKNQTGLRKDTMEKWPKFCSILPRKSRSSLEMGKRPKKIFKKNRDSFACEEEQSDLTASENVSSNRSIEITPEAASDLYCPVATSIGLSWTESTLTPFEHGEDHDLMVFLKMRLLLGDRIQPAVLLTLNRLWGLLVQRALYSYRSRTMTCLQILVPVCFLMMGLSLYKRDYFIFEKKIVLDSRFLRDTSVVLISDSQEPNDLKLAEAYKDTLYGPNEMLLHVDEIQYTRFPTKSRNLQLPGNEVGLPIILIGTRFSDLSPKVSSLKVIAYYNSQAYHYEPLSIAIIMQSLQRFHQPEANRTVGLSIQPLNLTKQDNDNRFSNHVHYSCWWTSVSVVLTLTFVTSMFAVFPLQDRMNGTKHLQTLSGVNSFLYLGSSFLWDSLVYFVACAFVLVILVIWKRVAFEENAGLHLVLLLTYGMTNLFLIYTFQNCFHNPATSVIVIFLSYSTIVCTFLFFCLKEWFELIRMPATTSPGDYRFYPLYLIPPCNLLVSLYGMCVHHEIRWHCQPTAELCSGDPHGMKGSSGLCHISCLNSKSEELDLVSTVLKIYFIGMLIGTLVWATVCFVLDSYRFNILRLLKLGLGESFEEDDYDPRDATVVAEKIRINLAEGDACLTLKNITLCENGMTILKGISIAIAKGENFCLLGRDLSGKSTLIDIMIGKIQPSSGSLQYNAESILGTGSKAQVRIGYCPEQPSLMDKLTGKETLALYGRLSGSPEMTLEMKINMMMETMLMLEVANKLCADYSPSERKLLSLCIALIGDPDILILDEPTKDMDVLTRHRVWKVLSHLNTDQQVLFLATSDTDECAALSTRIGILAGGMLTTLLPTNVLNSRHGTGYTCMLSFKKDGDSSVQRSFFTSVADSFYNVQIMADSRIAYLHFPNESTNLAKLFSVMEDGKAYFHVDSYVVQKTNLDHVMYFLSVCPDVQYLEMAPGAVPFDYWPPEKSTVEI